MSKLFVLRNWKTLNVLKKILLIMNWFDARVNIHGRVGQRPNEETCSKSGLEGAPGISIQTEGETNKLEIQE
jgi:hypothetical protein